MSKKALIGFLTAGDPSLEKTEECIVAMEKAGAAIIEIGIPFSDPIAEGQIIQNANVRALSGPDGCTTDMVFDMIGRVRAKVSVPLVLVTYLNPVFKYGYEAFCKKCKEIGISGIIIPDMPYEEKNELVPIADQYGINILTIIVPTDSERIKMIAKEAKGHIYLADFPDEAVNVGDMVKDIRSVTDIPVIMAYAVKHPEQAAKYSKICDGVAVRSGIVEIIEEKGDNAAGYIYDYIKSMIEVM